MSNSAVDQIIDWSKQLPHWQAEAVRRLLLKSSLDKKDEEEILLMLKIECGLSASEVISNFKPLSRSEFAGASSDVPKISLNEMVCLDGINAIPQNSIIKYQPEGITIIYGDNGVGKSGYARVLKKACRARDTSETILPNVFEHRVSATASALFKIKIQDDYDEQEIKWYDGIEESNILSSINVFDSKCARVIVDKKNKAYYKPYGTHVFEELATIVKKLKTQLEIEKPKPEWPQIEGLNNSTKIGKFINLINPQTDIKDIEKNIYWSEKDEVLLEKKTKNVASIEVNDPFLEAEKYKKQREKIKNIGQYFLDRRKKLGDIKYRELINKINDLEEAENALQEVSKTSLAHEPLSGAGTSSWQILYKAAKDYSLQFAYPQNEFPHILEDSRCVLCMQPLDEDAKERFKRFKSFMEAKTNQEYENKKRNLENLREEVDTVNFIEEEIFKERVQDFQTFKNEIFSLLWEYSKSLEYRKEQFLKSIDELRSFVIPSLPPCPKRELKTIDDILKDKIDKCIKNAKPEEHALLTEQKKELETRKLVYSHLNSIKEYVNRSSISIKYDKCLANLNTRNITIKGRDVVAASLSPQLVTSLSNELQLLGGNRIPISIKITGDYGATEHQLLLNGVNFESGYSLSQILSEGEQKVIAIAGFLAELKVSNQNNPIVFDDPVNSLDHKFRTTIARRLANEGLERQVIIFTHDLAFVLLLIEECENIGCKYLSRSIERSFNIPGICSENPPWYALNVKVRIGILKNELQSLRNNQSKLTETEYFEKVRVFYGKLRETWERLIEELLLNGVVHRFGRDVQPTRIKLLSDIEKTDIEFVLNGWEKCSAIFWGHDKAADLNEPPPSLEEIEKDITEMDNYRIELSNKRKRSARKT